MFYAYKKGKEIVVGTFHGYCDEKFKIIANNERIINRYRVMDDKTLGWFILYCRADFKRKFALLLREIWFLIDLLDCRIRLEGDVLLLLSFKELGRQMNLGCEMILSLDARIDLDAIGGRGKMAV